MLRRFCMDFSRSSCRNPRENFRRNFYRNSAKNKNCCCNPRKKSSELPEGSYGDIIKPIPEGFPGKLPDSLSWSWEITGKTFGGMSKVTPERLSEGISSEVWNKFLTWTENFWRKPQNLAKQFLAGLITEEAPKEIPEVRDSDIQTKTSHLDNWEVTKWNHRRNGLRNLLLIQVKFQARFQEFA